MVGRTPRMYIPSSKKECDCELYYSDSAIRERCAAMIISNRNAYLLDTDRKPAFYPIEEAADRLFNYIKSGIIPDKQ